MSADDHDNKGARKLFEDALESDDDLTRTMGMGDGGNLAQPGKPHNPGASIGDSRFFDPGTVFADRFRIVSLLGQGGMGRVYRADDLKLNRPVALKFLPENLDQHLQLLEALYNEVRQALQVSHRNVSRVYDIGETEGLHFMSMEWIKGEDLKSLLRRIGRLPDDKALELAQQLCAGLSAAHEEGLLHLDLKPANLMIDERGDLKITDFGLAQLISEAEAEKRIAGTPPYMAPEQLLRGESSKSSDIYAVGLILYEMFTGKMVHARRTIDEIRLWHRASGVVDPPSESTPSLPPEIEQLIMRCLERNPSRRPESVQTILQELESTGPWEASGSSSTLGPSPWNPGKQSLDPKSPYLGLRRFEETDKANFFGRDALIDELLEASAGSALLMVVGASGSGKSSVVRAGVAPKWRESHHSNDARALVITPDVNPFESFYIALCMSGYSQSDSSIARAASATTIRKAAEHLRKGGEPWLLFIDQFEECFTRIPRTKEGTRLLEDFLASLVDTCKWNDPGVRIVLAMRDDFFPSLGQHPKLARITDQNLRRVTVMDRAALREVIERPAAEHGVGFEAGLTAEIMEEVEGRPGMLPLLQYTLHALWERDDLNDRLLHTESYRALGGVRGALQKRVDAFYEKLPDSKHEVLRRVMLRLVEIGETKAGAQAVSQRAAMDEFQSEDDTTLLRELIEQKLLVSSAVGGSDDTPGCRTVELAHEALIGAWPQFEEWIEESRDAISARNRLRQDCARWNEVRANDKTKAGEELLTGSRLAVITEMEQAGEFALLGGLNDGELAYVEASRTARERTEKRRRRILTGWLTGVSVLALATGLLGVKAQKRAADLTKANKKITEASEEIQDTLAQSFVTSIGQSDFLFSSLEVDAIWSLAQQGGDNARVKDLYLEKVLSSNEALKTLFNRRDPILHSVVGLDRESTAEVAATLAARMSMETDKLALSILGYVLGSLGDRLPPETAAEVAATLAARMSMETDNDALCFLGSVLGSLGERLPPETAAKGAGALAARMSTETESFALLSLGSVLGSLGEHLPSEAAAKVADSLAARMSTETYNFEFPSESSDALCSLGTALGSLGKRLSPEAAAQGAAALAARMSTETNSDALLGLGGLGRALGSLGERLTPEAAAKVADALVARMMTETNSDALSDLSSALGSLGERLTPEAAGQVAAELAARMSTETDNDALFILGSALGSLVERLTPEAAGQVAAKLAARISTETDTDAVRILGPALGSLGERLTPEAAGQVAAGLAARMSTEIGNDTLFSHLGSALGSLGERLPPEPAGQVAAVLAERMSTETHYRAFSFLGETLGSLGERLPPEPAAQVAAMLAARMLTESGSYALSSLGTALGSLGERLPPELAAQVTAVLAERMSTESESYRLSSLGEALGSFGERLPPELAAQVATMLAERMSTETHHRAFSFLGEALGSLGERLPPEPAAQGAAALAARMSTEADTDALCALGTALGNLGERLPPESAAQGAAALAARMSTETDTDALCSLGTALGSLGKRLPPEAAAQGAAALAARMSTETYNFEFPSESSDALCSLGTALGSLGKRLPPEAAAQGAAALVAEMEAVPYFFSNFGEALESLAEIPTDCARVGTSRYLLMAAQRRATESTRMMGERKAQTDSAEMFLSLTEQLLAALLSNLSEQQLVDVLKDPFCHGEAKEFVEKTLEERLKKEGQSVDFAGDLWRAAGQLEKLGFDVKSPPVRPKLENEDGIERKAFLAMKKMKWNEATEAWQELVRERLMYIEEMLALDPDDATAWIAKGDVLELLDRGDDAIEAYVQAAELLLDSDTPEPNGSLLTRLAGILDKYGKSEKAALAYVRTAELLRDPDNPRPSGTSVTSLAGIEPEATANGTTVNILPAIRSARTNGDSTEITFVNKTDREVLIFWVSNPDEPTAYGKVNAGQRIDQQTYAGHVWLVTDPDKKPLGVFEAVASPGIAVIDGSWKFGKPEEADLLRYNIPLKSKVIVLGNSEWKWLHPTDGTDPAVQVPDFHQSFFKTDFDDSSWRSGTDAPGPTGGFGYGEANFEGVDIGDPDSGNRFSAYFRCRFTTTEEATNLQLLCQRDDGIIVYLDGVEVARDEGIEGTDAYELLSTQTISNDFEIMINRYPIHGALPAGEHILAISLHNVSPTSSDLRIGEITLIALPKKTGEK